MRRVVAAVGAVAHRTVGGVIELQVGVHVRAAVAAAADEIENIAEIGTEITQARDLRRRAGTEHAASIGGAFKLHLELEHQKNIAYLVLSAPSAAGAECSAPFFLYVLAIPFPLSLLLLALWLWCSCLFFFGLCMF